MHLQKGDDTMPYTHSGEIGDVWKHFPLCDIFKIEAPKRYFETNSAFAEYKLEETNQSKYGILHFYGKVDPGTAENSSYFKVLNDLNLKESHHYYGSPALALILLSRKVEHYYFHDIESEPLDSIVQFARNHNMQDKVTVSHGDSISAFLHGLYCFNPDDFVFIDPYQLFDCNEAGETFFDVFEKAFRSHAKTILWYGYSNLYEKNKIIDELQSISFRLSGTIIHTFDVWQKCMNQNTCKINPGVSGCGIAVSNLLEDSIQITEKNLKVIGNVYQDVYFEGERSSLCAGHLVL